MNPPAPDPTPDPAPDATPAGVLARAGQGVRDRRTVSVREFETVLAWVDLHSEAPEVEVEGGDSLIALGGEGTPGVRDLCLAELAIARSEHVLSTRSLAADLLDLRHRLPHVWAQVRALRLEGWVARKTAAASRKLSRDAVRVVDAAVAAAVGQSPSRVLAIVEAKVIEADTETRAEQIQAARALKGVWLTGTRDQDDAPGMRSVYARLESADAVWVDATVQRVTDILAADPDLRRLHHPELGQDPSNDELRAAAFAWLARPHDLAQLLGLIEEQDTDDLARRRRSGQSATLYVHLDQQMLDGACGVARCDLGPLLLDQVTSLLGHAHVTIKPVIDLNTGHSVNGYEHPTVVKERTLLRTIGTVFPHGTGTARPDSTRIDHDHPAPYDPGGPPGQTGDHNDAPLTRREHRAKTHLAYRVEQLAPGTYLWTTPHGLHRLVNHTGTHHLTNADADLIRRLHAA